MSSCLLIQGCRASVQVQLTFCRVAGVVLLSVLCWNLRWCPQTQPSPADGATAPVCCGGFLLLQQKLVKVSWRSGMGSHPIVGDAERRRWLWPEPVAELLRVTARDITATKKAIGAQSMFVSAQVTT